MNSKLLMLSAFLLMQHGSFGQTLYTDEDLEPLLKFGNASDRDYTMGLGLGPRRRYNPNALIYRPGKWIASKVIGKRMPDEHDLLEFQPPWTLNGTAFTPDDLTSSTPITDDRPYSFILYLSTKQLYLDVRKHELITSELNYGITGTHIGKWVQTKIHNSMNDGDTKDPHTPRGWKNQISNGGEPTFLYSVSYEKLLTNKRIDNFRNQGFGELKHGMKAMIGYYTGLQYQVAGRLGLLDLRNWIRNTNPLGSGDKDIFLRQQATADLNLGKITQEKYDRIIKSESAKDYYNGRKKFEAYFFSSLRPTLILYNELLNGKIRHSAHTFNFRQTQHFVLEWTNGLGIGLPVCDSYVNFLWTVNAGRTVQFRTSKAEKHQWGGLAITITPNSGL